MYRPKKMLPPRKPPAKRAFTGLVGLPPESEPTHEHAVAPTAAKGPGRPSKGARTMTGAERTQKYRQGQKKKFEDKERRDLVAQLVKIYRRMLPFADLKSPLAHKVLAERRQRLQKISDEWVLLPVTELQKTLGVYQEKGPEGLKLYIDARGRLSGESSGEADRKDGLSGTEQQIAMADGESSDHDEGLGDATSNYNTESESSTRGPQGGLRIPAEHLAYLEDREEIITELVQRYTRAEGSGLRCLLCKEVECLTSPQGSKMARITYPVFIADPTDARQHFWLEYDKGLKLYYRWQELSEDPGVAQIAQFMIDDSETASLNHKHLREVWNASARRKAEQKAAEKAAAISSQPKNSP
jgi:hypothetical protein